MLYVGKRERYFFCLGWDLMGAGDREVFEKEETGKLYLKEGISLAFVSVRACEGLCLCCLASDKHVPC